MIRKNQRKILLLIVESKTKYKKKFQSIKSEEDDEEEDEDEKQTTEVPMMKLQIEAVLAPITTETASSSSWKTPMKR